MKKKKVWKCITAAAIILAGIIVGWIIKEKVDIGE